MEVESVESPTRREDRLLPTTVEKLEILSCKVLKLLPWLVESDDTAS